jgi:hypothetical protein
MSGHHTLLLQLQFPRFLRKSTGGAAPTAAEVAASSTFDTITLANTFTAAHLDDTTQSTAHAEGRVSEAVATAGGSAFGVRVASELEMLETGLVLTVDDAGEPPRDETCEREGEGGY